jgi:DNA-binding CsgD family transcriptional regulator
MPEHESTARFAALPRENPNPVMAAAADGRLIYVNPAAQQIAARLDVMVVQLLPPSHRDIVQSCLRAAATRRVDVRVDDRHLLWTYRAAADDAAVYIYGQDLSELGGMMDTGGVALKAGADWLTTGVMLIDEGLHVLYQNRAAAAIVDSAEQIALEDGQRLAVHDKQAQARLESLLKQAAAPGGRDGLAVVAVPRPPPEGPLELLLARYTGNNGHGEFRALLFLVDPERPLRGAEELLCTLHGLTRSEARLAALLAQGLRPAEAAARLGVGITTVRSHLRQLFRKTATRRQAELVRRICGGLAGALLEEPKRGD